MELWLNNVLLNEVILYSDPSPATRVQTACLATTLTTAMVWSDVPDAILVIAHPVSNYKSRLEIYTNILKNFFKSILTQYNGKNDLPVVAE